MAEEFSEDEIRRELENLGYHDVPPSRLARLKADLEMFVAIDRSKSSTDSTRADDSTLTGPEKAENGTSEDWVSSGNAGVRGNNMTSAYNSRLTADMENNGDSDHDQLIEQRLDDGRFQMEKDDISVPANASLGDRYNSVHLNEQDYSYNPILASKEYEYEYVPRDDFSRMRTGSYENFRYRNSDDLRTFYMSVPERDRLTGYRSTENLDTTITSTSSTGEKKKMKRKVLRKIDGQTHVDESVTESETDEDVLGLMKRLTRLPLDEKTNYQERFALPRRPYSAAEPAYRLPDSYEGPKSIIRPITAHPHTKNIRKADPVSRHQMYQQSWGKHRCPDEKSHKSLRWSVREQMLYHDEVTKKTPRTYEPNTYVVPSDKKRKALRWQIRQDMAEGVIPHSQWY